LIRTDEGQSEQGIPGLSEIPVLGRLFKNNSTDRRRTDIVLTLTPHIIRRAAITEADLLPSWVGTESNITFRGGSSRIESDVSGPFDADSEDARERVRERLRERLRQSGATGGAGRADGRGEEAPSGRGAGDRLERLKRRLDRDRDDGGRDGRVGRLERALTRHRLERARATLDRHRERLDGVDRGGRDREEARGHGAGREAERRSGTGARGAERGGRGQGGRRDRGARGERDQGCGSGCSGAERGPRASRGERREV
jgi:hypothetical protein